jgi:hypothetical protein
MEPHQLLEQLVGEWEGHTKTWYEQGKLADESPWQGSIRLLKGGRYAIHEYRGEIEGKLLEGLVIYGWSKGRKRWETAWIDSFHTATEIMFSTGSGEAFSVTGTWPVEGGPDWGWRTEMQLNSPDDLVITHYVITPDGQEGKGVETVYQRVRKV